MKNKTLISIFFFLLILIAPYHSHSENLPKEISKTVHVLGRKDIQFTKRERIFDPIYSPARSAKFPSDLLRLEIYCFKIGTITKGYYKNCDLVLCEVNYSEDVCKGDGCEGMARLRFIRKGKKMIFLPKISEEPPFAMFKKNKIKRNPFKSKQYTLSRDRYYTIPILEYPAVLKNSAPRQVLHFGSETDEQIDKSSLIKLFNHPIFGDIFTTAPGSDPEKNGELNDSFVVFRPDGTSLIYQYWIDFKYDQIIWDEKSPLLERTHLTPRMRPYSYNYKPVSYS